MEKKKTYSIFHITEDPRLAHTKKDEKTGKTVDVLYISRYGLSALFTNVSEHQFRIIANCQYEKRSNVIIAAFEENESGFLKPEQYGYLAPDMELLMVANSVLLGGVRANRTNRTPPNKTEEEVK